jgi:hypothetical protein
MLPLPPGIDQAAGRDESCQRANGERAAAEAEHVDLVARVVHARELVVEVFDVSTETPPGRAGKDLQRLEVLRADAIVVDGDLGGELRIVAMTVEVHGFKQLEDIRAAPFDCRVARAVRTHDDSFGHRRVSCASWLP